MSGTLFVSPIAGGKGEVDALPRLVRRFATGIGNSSLLRINPVVRVKESSFLRDDDYFRRYFEMAARPAACHERGVVLIVLDCEDDCPGVAGPGLFARARKVRSDIPTLVVLAHREFETWFIAAVRSLRGIAGIPEDTEAPPDPEAIRGAKEWLSRCIPGGYDPVRHQGLFAEQFAIDEAVRIPSFARFRTRFESLLRHPPLLRRG